MLICDSESNGFKWEADKIWVIHAFDKTTGRLTFSFDDSVYKEFDIRSLLNSETRSCSGSVYTLFDCHEDHIALMNKREVCFHNYFAHDKPLIKKFYPWLSPKQEHDTYILSQLFNPDREIPKGCKGAHGLDAWSRRVGREGKVVHEDWSKFSPEMLHRVIEDVKDNVAAWNVLMQEKKEWEDAGGSWDEAIKIEYSTADLLGRQEMHGLLLDVDKAYSLADEIYTEVQRIDEILLEQMPPRVVRGSTVEEPFKKNGELKEVVKKWFN